MSKRTKKDVYDIVNERLLEGVEQGHIPWRQKWLSQRPINADTRKGYRGINVALLGISKMKNGFELNAWLTYRQAKKLGGNIKKGSKSSMVVFYKPYEVKPDGWEDYDLNEIPESEKEYIPLLRYYNVFNVEQTEGIDLEQFKVDYKPVDTIAECEKIMAAYKDCPEIRKSGDEAYYHRKEDYINMPATTFESAEHYYAVLFHEAIHSTGAEKRLSRKGVTRKDMDRTLQEEYSFEELIAETGASYLCSMAGIDIEDVTTNNKAYIQSWLKVLQNNKKWLVQAFSRAEKAVEYITQEAEEEVIAA